MAPDRLHDHEDPPVLPAALDQPGALARAWVSSGGRIARRTAGSRELKLVNDDYAAYLGWKPEGGPQSDFQFVRTNTFDGNRAFQDTTKDFGSLVSNYNYKNLSAYYHGAYLDTDDRLRGFETEQVSHAARVGYSGSFIDKRLLWNATYNVNYQDIKTRTQRAGWRGRRCR